MEDRSKVASVILIWVLNFGYSFSEGYVKAYKRLREIYLMSPCIYSDGSQVPSYVLLEIVSAWNKTVLFKTEIPASCIHNSPQHIEWDRIKSLLKKCTCESFTPIQRGSWSLFLSEIKRYVAWNIQKRSSSSYSVGDEIAMAGYKNRKCSYQPEDSGICLEGYSRTVSTSDRIYVPSRDSNSLSSKYETTAVKISHML